MSNAEHHSPPELDFAQLHLALVTQLPQLAPAWWQRVQAAAARKNSADELALLQAEALNRLDHAERERQAAVVAVLFKILGAVTSQS